MESQTSGGICSGVTRSMISMITDAMPHGSCRETLRWASTSLGRVMSFVGRQHGRKQLHDLFLIARQCAFELAYKVIENRPSLTFHRDRLPRQRRSFSRILARIFFMFRRGCSACRNAHRRDSTSRRRRASRSSVAFCLSQIVTRGASSEAWTRLPFVGCRLPWTATTHPVLRSSTAPPPLMPPSSPGLVPIDVQTIHRLAGLMCILMFSPKTCDATSPMT